MHVVEAEAEAGANTPRPMALAVAREPGMQHRSDEKDGAMKEPSLRRGLQQRSHRLRIGLTPYGPQQCLFNGF